MTQRGDVHWVDLGPAVGSRPAKRRPVLIVQADSHNRSRLATVLVAVISSNTSLAVMPGNVFLPAVSTNLPRDSVVNITALVTLDRSELGDPIGHLPDSLLREVDTGLQGVLGL